MFVTEKLVTLVLLLFVALLRCLGTLCEETRTLYVTTSSVSVSVCPS